MEKRKSQLAKEEKNDRERWAIGPTRGLSWQQVMMIMMRLIMEDFWNIRRTNDNMRSEIPEQWDCYVLVQNA